MFDLNDGGLFRVLVGDGQTETNFVLIRLGLYLGIALLAYLVGSLNISILLSKIVYHDDVRSHGSGNAGLTNMLRTYGKGAALATLIGDLLKNAVAIFIGAIGFGFCYLPGAISISEGCYLAGFFAVIGHVFPLYYGFKGGKGVLATAVTALILSPLPFLLLLLVFIAIVAMSKYVSLGSVSVASLYPVVLYGTFAVIGIPEPGVLAITSVLLAILIVGKHKENLKRISDRTENKLSFGKKKNDDEE